MLPYLPKQLFSPSRAHWKKTKKKTHGCKCDKRWQIRTTSHLSLVILQFWVFLNYRPPQSFASFQEKWEKGRWSLFKSGYLYNSMARFFWASLWPILLINYSCVIYLKSLNRSYGVYGILHVIWSFVEQMMKRREKNKITKTTLNGL